jgi:hypothetical protein
MKRKSSDGNTMMFSLGWRLPIVATRRCSPHFREQGGGTSQLRFP